MFKIILFVPIGARRFRICTYARQARAFFYQPVHCSRASPSGSARLQPKPVPPEPVLAARNGPSRADGLARARRITALEKLGTFKYTGTLPECAKVKGVKLEPVVEELPLEPPPKKRKTRKMAEKLRDSFNVRPRNRIRDV